MERKRVAIIGAGVAGLATSIRLAATGFTVDVFERESHAGGKIGQILSDGYRFDTGPSLFTLPELLTALYDVAKTPAADRLKVIPLNEVCNYYFADGKKLQVPADRELFAGRAESMLGEPATHTRQYLSKAEKLYNLTSRIFIFSPFQLLKKLFVRENLPVALKLGSLKAFSTLHRLNRRSFSKDEMVQLFDRYATYNGSSPFKTPATLRMIAHLEHNLGAWFPDGGMRAIVDSLKKEADILGVKFHFDTAVREIVVKRKRIRGIRTGVGVRKYDHVVSNADVFNTYANLLPGKRKPLSLRRKELSTSAVIFYWGIRGCVPGPGLHNVLFSGQYKLEFKHLFGKGTCFADPTVYLYISKKGNPSDAPEGCENWYAMVNASPDYGQYTPDTLAKIRGTVLSKINSTLGIDLAPMIEFERTHTPVTLAKYTGAYRGALYGPASNSPWSAFLRHPNFSRRYRNLWFTGGTVHPGGGIPLCLSGAAIVAELIAEASANDPETR